LLEETSHALELVGGATRSQEYFWEDEVISYQPSAFSDGIKPRTIRWTAHRVVSQFDAVAAIPQSGIARWRRKAVSSSN
jgi:hypothetical protein